jgi:hypothetical protein
MDLIYIKVFKMTQVQAINSSLLSHEPLLQMMSQLDLSNSNHVAICKLIFNVFSKILNDITDRMQQDLEEENALKKQYSIQLAIFKELIGIIRLSQENIGRTFASQSINSLQSF